MSLHYTHHGRVRAGQRGLSRQDIELVRRYGTDIKDREHEVYLMRRKDVDAAHRELKALIQRLEHMAGCTAVLSGDEVITVYRASTKAEKALLRR